MYIMSSQPRRRRRTVKKKMRRKRMVSVALVRQPELHYHDVTSGAVLMGPAGATFMSTITTIAQGTGTNQRVGNVVRPKGIHLRLSSLYNPLATTGNQLYRIIAFQYLLSGGIGGVTEYLQTASFYSQKSIDNRFNSKTLYDKTFEVSNDHPQRNHFIKLKVPKPIYYPNAPGTTPEKNGVAIIVISNEPTLLNSPSIEGTGRYYFTE